MKISITAILVFFVYSISFAQGKGKEYNFSPIWKKGDERTITVTTKTTNYKDGELDEEDQDNSIMISRVKVVSESSASYTWKIEMDDFIFMRFEDLFLKIEKELPSLDNIVLMVRIDKETLGAEILNWKEAQETVQQNIDNTTEVIVKKMPDLEGIIGLMMQPIKDLFNDKETVSEFFMEQYGFLFLPLNKPLSKAKSHSEFKNSPSPFDPSQMMEMETKYIVETIDKKNTTCKIKSEIIFDFSKIKNMMKEMMQNIFEHASKEEEIDQAVMDEKMQEIDALEMNMINHQYVNYNYKTGWPSSASSYAEIYANDPSGENKRIVNITFTIN